MITFVLEQVSTTPLNPWESYDGVNPFLNKVQEYMEMSKKAQTY